MWGGCWGRCGDADACVLFIFDLLIRAADQNRKPKTENLFQHPTILYCDDTLRGIRIHFITGFEEPDSALPPSSGSLFFGVLVLRNLYVVRIWDTSENALMNALRNWILG